MGRVNPRKCVSTRRGEGKDCPTRLEKGALPAKEEGGQAARGAPWVRLRGVRRVPRAEGQGGCEEREACARSLGCFPASAVCGCPPPIPGDAVESLSPCRGTSAPTWSRPSSSSLCCSACGQKGPRGPSGLQRSEPEGTVDSHAPPPPRGPQRVWGLRIHVPGEQQFGPEWFYLGWGEDGGRVSLHDLSAGTARTPGRGPVQGLGPSEFSQIDPLCALSAFSLLLGALLRLSILISLPPANGSPSWPCTLMIDPYVYLKSSKIQRPHSLVRVCQHPHLHPHHCHDNCPFLFTQDRCCVMGFICMNSLNH